MWSIWSDGWYLGRALPPILEVVSRRFWIDYAKVWTDVGDTTCNLWCLPRESIQLVYLAQLLLGQSLGILLVHNQPITKSKTVFGERLGTSRLGLFLGRGHLPSGYNWCNWIIMYATLDFLVSQQEVWHYKSSSIIIFMRTHCVTNPSSKIFF